MGSETSENLNTDEDEKIIFIKKSLKDLIDFKYQSSLVDNNTNPFYYVYKLLDEIGKKLGWPIIQSAVPISAMPIEDKITYLLNLKAKNDKQISVASLSKQISFYGLVAFFDKLIEFEVMNKVLFSDMLIMATTFQKEEMCEDPNSKVDKKNYTPQSVVPAERAISNLIYTLKLWHKFVQHKEFYNIISKCLSNSKLDALSCYKHFISEYYNSYALGLNLNPNQNLNWTSVENVNLKQKIPVMAHLFMNEKSSFRVSNFLKVNFFIRFIY